MTDEPPAKRGRGRPKTTGTTPGRHLRVGAIWDEAAEIAEERGETISDVVRPIIESGLREYVERHRAGDPT